MTQVRHEGLSVATQDVAGFSIGGLGEQQRSFDRTYITWDGPPITNADVFINTLNSGRDTIQSPRHRRVVRALTTPQVARELVMDRSFDMVGAVEYAAPIHTSEGPLYIVGAAWNAPMRNGPGSQLEQPHDLPPLALRGFPQGEKPLSVRIGTAQSKGLRFTSTLDSDKVFNGVSQQLKRTFGWTDQGLYDLRERLGTESSADFPQDQRSVFLTTTIHAESEDPVGISMAEALRLPLSDGQEFTIWESTEWASIFSDNYVGSGATSPSVALTHSQIVDNGSEQGNFTIVAETNMVSRADTLARAVGMQVPEPFFDDYDPHSPTGRRHFPPHVLKDNVGVDDRIAIRGVPMIEDGKAFLLRDFSFFHVPDMLVRDLSRPENVKLTRRVLSKN